MINATHAMIHCLTESTSSSPNPEIRRCALAQLWDMVCGAPELQELHLSYISPFNESSGCSCTLCAAHPESYAFAQSEAPLLELLESFMSRTYEQQHDDDT